MTFLERTFSEAHAMPALHESVQFFDDVDERFIPSIKWNYICNIKYDCKHFLHEK